MRIYTFVVLIVALFGCDNNRLFEDNYKLEERYWHVDSIATFNIDVESVENTYDIFINLRSTSAYPYYNLYVKYILADSAGNILVEDLENLILFDSKTGQPKGDGLGDVFDHQIKLIEKYTFNESGNYKISYQQFMRIDSLPQIEYVGARVALTQ